MLKCMAELGPRSGAVSEGKRTDKADPMPSRENSWVKLPYWKTEVKHGVGLICVLCSC